MAFADKIRHLFRPHEPARPARMTEAEAEQWIAERQALVDHYSDEELDAIARTTFADAKIDREQFLREGQALREQLAKERSLRARHSPQ